MLANLIFLPPEELADRYDHIAHVGDTLVVDIHIPDFQGRGAYFWAKASPLYGAAGEVTGAIETIRDITDRKMAEQDAEANRRRLSDIIDFLPDPTMVIDTEGVVIAWNHAMEVLTDVPAAEMVGRGDHEYALPFYGQRQPILADLVFLPPEELADRYDHIARDGETLVVDIFVPAFRGHGGYLWAKAGPLRDAGGNLTGAIETVRDITERREMEERLARSNAELEIAREIQQSFLPDVIPQLGGYDIAGRCVMAKEVGGDFFDAIPFEVMALGDETLGVLIADVAGKGVPAALFMALSRVVVRVNAHVHPDPARTIEDANDVIAQDASAGMFVTMFYGLLSEKRRELTYVNAGHNPPLVFRGDGMVERLLPTGIALGARAGREYTSSTVAIGAGDVAVLYTDGVTEAIDSLFGMYGEERMLDVVRAHDGGTALEIVDAIFAAVEDFCAGEPQFDDITLLVIKGK